MRTAQAVERYRGRSREVWRNFLFPETPFLPRNFVVYSPYELCYYNHMENPSQYDPRVEIDFSEQAIHQVVMDELASHLGRADFSPETAKMIVLQAMQNVAKTILSMEF